MPKGIYQRKPWRADEVERRAKAAEQCRARNSLPRSSETNAKIAASVKAAWEKLPLEEQERRKEQARAASRRTADQRSQTLKAKHTGPRRSYEKQNSRHKHRVMAEEMLGRPLEPGEIVHHKDDDKQHNDYDNFEVMTQAEHARLHNLEQIRRGTRDMRAVSLARWGVNKTKDVGAEQVDGNG